MGYLGRFQFSNSYRSRVSAIDCPNHPALCYSTEQNSPLVHLYSPVKRCGSHHAIKNGSIHNGKPKRQCKECSRQFVINPTNKTVSDETKQLSCS